MISQKFHFIVIDDNPLDRYMSERILSASGKSLSTKTFNCALDALKDILKKPATEATVIFTDLHMPIMGGMEFAGELAKLPQHVKGKYAVFVASSTVREKDREQAKEKGAIDILPKPLVLREVIPLLEKIKEL